MVDEQYRPNLIQALTRSPFHPCSNIEKTVYKAVQTMTPTLRATPIEEMPLQIQQTSVLKVIHFVCIFLSQTFI